MYKSSNFRPSQKATLRRSIGYDELGKHAFASPKVIRLSVIRLESDVNPTSIRTDKSGTKSRAEEKLHVGRVMIAANEVFKVGDQLDLHDIRWEIDSIHPRFDINGRLHHYQVDLQAWG